MAPFGFIDDGLEEERLVDENGSVWTIDMNEENQEKWKLDEYGDTSFCGTIAKERSFSK